MDNTTGGVAGNHLAVQNTPSVSLSTAKRYSTVMAEFNKKSLSTPEESRRRHLSSMLSENADKSHSASSYVRFRGPTDSLGDLTADITPHYDSSVGREDPIGAETPIVSKPQTPMTESQPVEEKTPQSLPNPPLPEPTPVAAIQIEDSTPVPMEGTIVRIECPPSQSSYAINEDNTPMSEVFLSPKTFSSRTFVVESSKSFNPPARDGVSPEQADKSNSRSRILSYEVAESPKVFRSPSRSEALQRPPEESPQNTYIVNDSPYYSVNLSQLSPFRRRRHYRMKYGNGSSQMGRKRFCLGKICVALGVVLVVAGIIGVIISLTGAGHSVAGDTNGTEATASLILDTDAHEETASTTFSPTQTPAFIPADITTIPSESSKFATFRNENTSPSNFLSTVPQNLPSTRVSPALTENPISEDPNESTTIKPVSSYEPPISLDIDLINAETKILESTLGSTNIDVTSLPSPRYTIKPGVFSTLQAVEKESTDQTSSVSSLNENSTVPQNLVSSLAASSTSKVESPAIFPGNITTLPASNGKDIDEVEPSPKGLPQVLPASTFPDGTLVNLDETTIKSGPSKLVSDSPQNLTPVTPSSVTPSLTISSSTPDPLLLNSRPEYLNNLDGIKIY